MVSNEVDVGYKVTVSKVFEASGVADGLGEFVVQPEPDSYVEANTQYLVTLDVNGVNKLYRELWTSGDFDDNIEVALSDYTYIMDENRIAGLTEGDAVVVRFEEVEVLTTDAFRAAVAKVAPKAAASDGGGGSGGGVLVVHLVYDEDTGKTAFDKTWKEVYDADSVSIFAKNESSKNAYIFKSMGNRFPSGKYVKVLNPVGTESTTEFIADSENGYPAAEL